MLFLAELIVMFLREMTQSFFKALSIGFFEAVMMHSILVGFVHNVERLVRVIVAIHSCSGPLPAASNASRMLTSWI